MVQTATLDGQELALALHALLRDLDPVRWRQEAMVNARERIQEIQEGFRALQQRLDAEGPVAALRAVLDELVRLLEECLPSEDLAMPDLRMAWMDFRAQLLPVYEDLAGALRVEDVHVPSLRPTNYRRNVLHMSGGVFALLVVQWLGSSQAVLTVAALFLGYAWSMEAGRRLWPGLNDRLMAFYGPVAHPHEWTRINSATWYCTALFMLALTGSMALCSVAVVVVGFSDPAAALVGRRFGRVPLLNGRTLEGSATFLVVAMTVTLITLNFFYPELARAGFPLALGAGLVAALAELFSRRVDDNLTIPLGAAAGMVLASAMFGIAL